MSLPLLMTFNAGSSTLKIGLFGIDGNVPVHLGRSRIDFGHAQLQLEFTGPDGQLAIPLGVAATDDLHGVLDEALDWISGHLSMHRLASVGHRVVHGGDAFSGPAEIDARTLQAIEALVPLAPLHQPQALRLIRAIRHLRPQLRQCASFDTAFHRSQAALVRRFAIPRALYDAGVKRYGFHGLSYRFIATRLAASYPRLAQGKVIAAHLGSGASLCALDAGVSRDTSMGFSTLDGIPMATRCGALDAGVVLHLQKQEKYTVDEVETILYHQSGLLGVSGISADSRVLVDNPAPAAREALDLFAFRIAGEIARLATTLGGLDAIVFTAGIGEHQPGVRAAICQWLGWLGVAVDIDANRANAAEIHGRASRAALLVLPTDEEQVIAEETLAILHAGAAT
ncbi:acetate kinase [Burkholderia lata]|uniref:Acetate kinase n=1 Tax=Burkholderia lata (strain ATCC 17760 / DSM 23089 / LMG 22485 / NCIMB 9086 / R18194 / 383) TaxID=482957 RepID=A0A6P2NN79_BURL3|nr:acetate/propionate family kinase [Burkholderia lata]VWB96226.1 acetate kinase [Burkholderia lata]VWC68655.1 acetate kinase [Burkholderia lata]